VCAREYGKKLDELGVTVESFFVYGDYIISEGGGEPPYHCGYPLLLRTAREFTDGNPFIPAYTVAELGEMLPDFVVSYHSVYRWICECRELEVGIARDFMDKTEADARALMLIWLIENKHVEVPS
jgi:hypothetical protein